MTPIMEQLVELSKQKYGDDKVKFYPALNVIVVTLENGEIHRITLEKVG